MGGLGTRLSIGRASGGRGKQAGRWARYRFRYGIQAECKALPTKMHRELQHPSTYTACVYNTVTHTICSVYSGMEPVSYGVFPQSSSD